MRTRRRGKQTSVMECDGDPDIQSAGQNVAQGLFQNAIFDPQSSSPNTWDLLQWMPAAQFLFFVYPCWKFQINHVADI